ncbi:hypothetical protein BGX38DRAFT_1316861 [Terfezia claveryi]|nr:hypothetical protein BGX38DRAFT_1316861 [Terfezia claveryi]
MQIKLLSILLLSSAFIPTILASATPAPVVVPNPVANADFGDIGDKLEDTASQVKQKVNDWVDEGKNWKFPTVTGVPENIKQWFSDSEKWFNGFPEKAWAEIKDGVYPPEVSNWVNSLPDQMKQEARDELKQWANEESNAPSLRGIIGHVGVFGWEISL